MLAYKNRKDYLPASKMETCKLKGQIKIYILVSFSVELFLFLIVKIEINY